MIRAVLDTNVLVAALQSRRGASHELLRLLGEGRWQIQFSTVLLLEYEAVARYEVRDLWLEPERVESLLDGLCANARERVLTFCSDPFLHDLDEGFIVELAVCSGAECIVTHKPGDFDRAKRFEIEVLTPGQMLMRLQETE